MSRVLPWIYSRANALRRVLGDAASNPLGSIQQTAGLIEDQHLEQQRLHALAFSDSERPFRMTDQNALAQLIDRTMQGPMGFAPVGMANLVKPLGTGQHYATESLSEYTPLLYRETSADRAVDFLPNSMSQPQQLWFSNEPAMALGQGMNKGVMMEFDAKGIPGQLSLSKPMARQSYDSGMAEFVSQDARPHEFGKNLRSIRISPDQQRGPYFRRIQGLLKDWNAQKEADGTLVLTKP